MRNTNITTIFCAVFLASIMTVQASAVSTSAESAILIEQGSGRVLYEQDADEERLIASITKIMTALVALEEGDLLAEYTVTAEDMAEGSSMYLKPGETLRLQELLYGLMLSSGNDAALAVAHCVAGSVEDFVVLMNKKAAELGLDHTSFENPNGLDGEKHYSSASDMARLTAYALENQDFCRIVSTSSITIGERYLANHNKLLRLYEGCIGVKTGYTKAAGRTLVSAARRGDMTLVCVTLCDGDDWNDHMTLLNHGFACYQLKTAASAGQVMTTVTVQGGTERVVPLILDKGLAYPLAEEEELDITVETPVSIQAPVIPGQPVGKACLWLDGELVGQIDLVAARASAAKE